MHTRIATHVPRLLVFPKFHSGFTYASLITAIVFQHSAKWPLHDSTESLITATLRRRSFKKFKSRTVLFPCEGSLKGIHAYPSFGDAIDFFNSLISLSARAAATLPFEAKIGR